MLPFGCPSGWGTFLERLTLGCKQRRAFSTQTLGQDFFPYKTKCIYPPAPGTSTELVSQWICKNTVPKATSKGDIKENSRSLRLILRSVAEALGRQTEAWYTGKAPGREEQTGMRPVQTRPSSFWIWDLHALQNVSALEPTVGSDGLEVFQWTLKSVIQIPLIFSYRVAYQNGVKISFSSPTFSATLLSVGSNKETQNILWLGWLLA